MDNAQRIEQMQHLLTESLQPTKLNIIDESHLHAGHAGAKEGKGHFRVQITCERFTGLRLIQQHRLIYDSLGDMMQTDIHALAIEIS
ncbi:MAG: BolA family transcriptional regulator [Gammaproteobacteria bacterium]|nr:BolA family transcriptional regulator [Gammaproteobacteria bacterium]NNJ72914.1 BolA family transcriptional regulator [Enterobacterales bacterium]